MKKNDIYEIAIKILGLYLVIPIINQLKEVLFYISLWSQEKAGADITYNINQSLTMIIGIASLIILCLFSGMLIFKTIKITKILCKDSDCRQEEIKLLVTRKTIYEISLGLLGLIMIVWTLPELIFKFNSLIFNRLHNCDLGYFGISVLKIIIGFLSIRYSEKMSTFLSKERKEIE